MAFPATPLGLTVELLIDGTWTDVTSLTYKRDDLTVTRGRPDEATKADRSTCRFTANNRSGNLSPRNPVGTYYGKIGRNTRMRARLSPASPGYLLVAGSPTGANSQATTPDSANLSITGDIDMRIDVRPDAWGLLAGLTHKYLSTGNQRSWAFWVNADNTLSVRWSPDGTFASAITKTSTVAVSPPASGRLALRVTIDVDNGAAGNDVKFYTAPDINGSWTQLGATVTTAGTTSIFDSTQVVGIGSANGAIAANMRGRVYAYKLFQGITGTLRADVNMDDEEAGAASFVDGQGLTWTLVGDTSIVDPAVRFSGEVSQWPQRWDVTGKDVYVPLEASGILRRLTQGASALKSTLYRGYTSATFTPKAYWPCEDAAGATSIASGLGGPPMIISGTLQPAQFDRFKCSSPLPLLGASDWIGNVPFYAGTGNVQAWFLMYIPTGAAVVGQDIFHVYTTGTATHWTIYYHAGTGSLRVEAYDSADTQLFSTVIGFTVNDRLLRVSFDLAQNGANIDWTVNTLEVGQSVGFGGGGTLNARTISRCVQVRVNSFANLDPNGQIAIGHISVHDQIRNLFDLYRELNAYTGEAAGRRVQRLCGEEGVGFRAVGDADATAAMGAQLPAELIALLREAEDADGGILYEPRDMFGLAYRARESLYNQAAGLALDYTAKHLSGIEPTDDDQQTRNDITVQRAAGSSARAVQETGTLSVAAPPAGVGRYDEQVTLNLQADAQVADAAGWLLHLGTVDEARYPILVLDLARGVFAADSALTLATQDLDVGGRLTVVHPPAWLPPDAITQLAQGMAETMSNFAHRLGVNCSPESPWGQAAVYDASASRYSSDGSTLASGVTSSATSLSVATPSGPLWTHADGDFAIRVGGEVMTVTAVSGAASPQTFTVTRSVNGVVKAHSSSASLALDHPVVYVR